VRFEVLTAASMKQAESTSEMLENFYQTTQHNSPEDSHLYYHLID
jgi:hypothetical protein